MRTPFLGSAYTSRSKNVAANRLINLYPEVVETKEGKEVAAFYGTPGEDLVLTAGTGPVRALHATANGGLLYVVSGANVYVVPAATLAPAVLGSMSTGSGPVSVIDNGTQVAFFDGTAGYVWNGSTFAQIALPFSGPVTAAYQDGFGLVNRTGSDQWFQSNYKDLSTWLALNFGTSDSKPDDVVAIADLHREAWLMGQTSTEVWINAGNPNFAFQRLSGVFIESGTCAPFSLTRMNEFLVWLSLDDQGQGVVMRNEGYSPKRISTHAVEEAIRRYAATVGISDAIGFAYQDVGHSFYVLTFPAANATWVWDANTREWHQRAAFVNGLFNRHDANCYAFFTGRHLIGDWQSGNVYALNPDRYDDNGRPLKWLRAWRALQKPSEQPVTFHSLRIDLETGITVPATVNPQLALRWSDDGGNSWSNEHLTSWGVTGATANRAMFRRLGSTRRSTGLDRVFELSSSDPVRAALIGAELEASA